MRSIRLLILLLCYSLSVSLVQAQCTSGCTVTYNSGGSINPTANNQTICITGSGSYTYSSTYSNVHIKICASDVTLSSFSINSATALNNKIETWSPNTTVSNVNVTADTFQLISHSTNTRLTSGTFNKKSKFITTTGADITLASNLNPGDKVFFDIADNSTITTADVTSNQGGQIYVGTGGTFTSTGTVTFQNDGELFNKGVVTVADHLTIQGGANALNNYCGKSSITVGGDFIVNTGVINNGGNIISERILINANSGPIYMKQGSTIEANRMANLDQLNIFSGDSIPSGECATFKINTSFNSWNQAMSNSSKINYCGVVPPAGKLGSASTSCVCTSVLVGCDIECKPTDAGDDVVYCTPLPVIDLVNTITNQIWVSVPTNPSAATIHQNTGEVAGMTLPGIYNFVLIDTIGLDKTACTDTIALTVVPKPLDNLTVSGGVFCSDQTNAIVTVHNAEPGVTYTALSGATILATGLNTGASATNLSIAVPLNLVGNGENVINISASIPGCSNVNLIDTAAIVKNPNPSALLTASGGIYCSTETTVTVQIANAEPGVTYNALLGGTQVGTATNSTAAATNLSITMPIGSFANGLNVLNFEANISGCATVALTDTAGVLVVPNPSNALTVNGSTICSNQTNTIVTIVNADTNVTYTALKGATQLGTGIRATAGNLDITIPTALLTNGDNTINIIADINGCATVALTDTANIKKVPNPSASLTATGGIFCTTETIVTAQIANAEPGVTYNALLGGTQVGTATNSTSSASNLIITMPIGSFANGLNVLNFEANISGCATVALTDTAGVLIVPNPSNALTVNGSTICSNQTNTIVTIVNADPNVTYTALKDATQLGTGTRATAGNLDITIPTALLTNGDNTINIIADINGCATIALTDTANIKKVPNPSALLTASGGIFCSTETTVSAQIANAEPGVTYNALLGGTQVGTATNSTSSASNLIITMPIGSFANGLNVLNFEANIAGCATVTLTDTAGVLVVPNPSSALTVNGSTICSNQTNTIVTIVNADPNVTYTALKGATQLGTGIRATAGNLEITIPTALLTNGDNTINISADINGCATVALLDTANILKVPNPLSSLTANGGIFCTSGSEVTVQIVNAESGVTYNALLGGTQVGTATNATATAANLSITMPIGSFANGLNVVSFEALIDGCAKVDLTDTAGVIVVPNPSSNLTVNGNIICSSSGSTTSITIKSALPFVSYSAYLGNALLGSDILPGTTVGDLIITIPISQLQNGDNTISVKADLFGCATVDLTDTANVILDPALTAGSITVENPLVCSSTSPVLLNDVLPTGGLSPLVYNWQYSTDGISWNDISGSQTSGPASGVPAIAVNTQYRRIVMSKLCTATTASVSASVILSMDGGEISTQGPNVCASNIPAQIDNIRPATGGTGSLLEYQWQTSVDGITWADISLANSVDYQPSVQLVDTYYRRKAINGSSTCDTSYAGPVLISVYDDLNPGTIQSGDTIVCDGSNIVVKNETLATGGAPGYTYLWQTSIAPFATWADVSASDVSSLNVNAISETTQFRRIVINTCGRDTSTAIYEVQVLPNLVSDIVFDTIPGLMCNTDQITITATTSDAGINRTVSWYLNDAPFTIIAGQPDSVFSEQGIWENGDKIKAVVAIESGKLCTTVSDSAEVTLQVNDKISRNDLSGNIQKACTIEDLKPIEASAANGTLGTPPYIWQLSTDSISWADIAGANDQNYLPEITTGLAYYRRIAVSAGACGNDTSSTSFEVRLDGNFDPGNIASDADSLCQGTSPVFTVTSPTGGLKPYSYQWESSTDNLSWLPINLATDSNYISPALTESTYFRRVVSTGTEFCSYNSNTVLVHVDTAVVSSSNTVVSDQAICEGMVPQQLSGSIPTGGLNPVQYQWIKSSDGITGWSELIGENGQNFQPDTLRQTTYYKRIVTSTGACANDTSATAVRIYVDPKLTSGQIVGHVGSVCQFELAELCGEGFTGGSPVVSLQWQQSIDDVNWTDILGQTNDTLKTGPLERTTNFRLILTSGLSICKDTSGTRKIVVNIPVDPGTNTIPSGQDICLGSVANTIVGSVPQGGLVNVRYQWLSSPNGIDNWIELKDSVRKDLMPGAAPQTIFYKRVITSTGACASDSSAGVYKLFVDTPVQGGKLGEDQQFCDKDTLFLNQEIAATGGTYINYTWQIASDTIHPIWETIPNLSGANNYIHRDSLPDYDAYYFRRIASSQACSAISDVMGVFPCLNPEVYNGYPGALCLNEALVDSIVLHKDVSKNGGGLVPRSILSLLPTHGQVTMIDTVNKVFTYKPELGFYGKDSIGFTVCDTSQFQRCSDKKIFITVLYSNNGPLVINEYYTEYRNTTIAGNILSNDSDPENDTLYVVDPVVDLPKNGNVSVDYDGNFQYLPYNGFTGKDSLVVTVCDFSSMNRCAQSICQPDTVYFNVMPNRVFVPDGFSPNNDGNHDVFVIKTDAPSNIHLAVYNRWGNVVYENKNYNNDWSGVANRGLVIGEGVPDGTYYIYYSVNDGEFEDFKFITLNR